MPLSDRIRRARYADAKRAGAALAPAIASPSSRQLLSDLETRYNIGLWFWDYKSKTFDWDQGMRRINGFPLDVPMPAGEGMPDKFSLDDRWMIHSVIEHGLPVSSWVNVVRREDGSESFHLCHVDILRDETGALDLAIGFVQDVTAHNQLEESLFFRASAQDAVFKRLGIVCWSSLIGGKLIGSSGLCEVTGAPPALLEGDLLMARIHPEDRAQLATWKARARTERIDDLRMELRLRTRSGDYRCFDAHGSVLDAPRSGHRVESWVCVPMSYVPNVAEAAPMTPRLLRTARSALGWSVQELSQRSGVSAATITRFEAGSSLRASSSDRLADTVREAGVVLEAMPHGGFHVWYNPSLP